MVEFKTYRDTIQAPEGAKTQRFSILRLLSDAHGAWVPLPEILNLGIAQYGARILELRRSGYAIENRSECVDGDRHSWFRLVSGPPSDSAYVKDAGASGYMRRVRQERAAAMPLFSGVEG